MLVGPRVVHAKAHGDYDLVEAEDELDRRREREREGSEVKVKGAIGSGAGGRVEATVNLPAGTASPH